MQATLAADPRLALVALLASIAPRIVGDLYLGDQWLKLSPTNCGRRLNELAPDLAQFPAQQALDSIGEELAKRSGLDNDSGEAGEGDRLLTWLLAQPMDELLRLFAYCVARTADLTTTNEASKPAEAFAKAIGFDMRK